MRKWLFAIFFLPFALLADDGEKLANSIASSEGLPSNIVNGSVCVITGEYVDNAVDLILPGPEPLILSRSYSSESVSGQFSKFWSFNHHASIILTKLVCESKEQLCILLTQPSSARIAYVHPKEKNLGSQTEVAFKVAFPSGLTNGGSGEISGRTNLKNQEVFYNSQEKKIKIISADQSIKLFDKAFTNEEKGNTVYTQAQERKENGNGFLYKHDPEKKGLQKIISYNHREGTNYSSLEFSGKDHKDYPTLIVKASNGQRVDYQLSKRKFKVKEKKTCETTTDCFLELYLEKVIASHLPETEYRYEEKKNYEALQITHKILPDYRTQRIEYYTTGLNELEDIKVKHKEEYQIDRVKTLYAPVGHNSELIPTHYFAYYINKDGSKKLKGSTEVYDAYLNKKVYYYNKAHRLTNIEHYTGYSSSEFALYMTENFAWGRKDTPKAGYLFGKYLTDSDGNIYCGHFFDYDQAGNITADYLAGNLTGRGCPALELNDNERMMDNGCEAYTKIKTYSQDGHNLLLSEEEPNGKVTTYEYLKNAKVLSKKFVEYEGKIQIREFFEYDENFVVIRKIIDDGISRKKGDLTGVTERRITEIQPRKEFPQNLPERVQEKYFDIAAEKEVLLKEIHYNYTAEGYPFREFHYDSNGDRCYTLKWKYDNHGNVIYEMNALGEEIFREYDLNDNLISEETPTIRKTFTYDYSNRLIKEESTSKNGQEETLSNTYEYDYLGNKTKSIDYHGNKTIYHYDEFGRLKVTKLPTEAAIRKEYDVGGYVICEKDANGNTTKTERNIRGQPTHIHYPDGTEEIFYYYLDGTLDEKIAKNKSKTKYTRDYQGRVLAEELFDSNNTLIKSTFYKYNAFHLLETIDGEGLKTTYKYDGAGRLIETAKGNKRTIQTYDSLGRIAEIREVIDQTSSRIRKKTYDYLDRLVEEKVEDNQGQPLSYAKFVYDTDGNVVLKQEGDAITKTTFNARKLPIQIIDALGHKTNIDYDYQFKNAKGEYVLKQTTTDPKGNQLIEIYNIASKIAEIIQKNAQGLTLAHCKMNYDSNDNKVEVIDLVYEGHTFKRNIYTKWEYNSVNEVTQLMEAVGTPEQKKTAFSFNEYGEKERRINPSGVELIHTYDGAGRLSGYQASDHSFSYSYRYNANDKPKEIKDNLNNLTNQFDYDSLGRLQAETLGNGLQLAFEYDSLDRKVSMKLPDQSHIRYEYTATDLKKITRIKNNQEVYSHEDSKHNLSGLVLEERSIAGPITYQYDLLGHILNMNSAQLKQTSVKYDPIGNLKSYLDGTTQRTFKYDDLYQLIEETRDSEKQNYKSDSLSNRILKNEEKCQINNLNQLLRQGEVHFRYDKDGNLIERKQGEDQLNFKYDALGRLIAVTSGSSEITYVYDSFNRRIARKQAGQSDQLFLYDGQEEFGLLEEGIIQELKIMKPKTRAKAVAIELSEEIFFPHYDITGHITCLNNQQGELVERYLFTAYGEEVIFDSIGNQIEAQNPWRYSGKRADQETGFIAFGLRYYNPETGRWITPDPIGYDDGPNLYAYTHNNPLSFFDAFGLFGIPKVTYHRNFEDGITHKSEEDFWREQTEYQETFKKYSEKSCIFDLGRPELPNKRIYHMNGINNTKDEARRSAEHLSDLAGGYNVHVIYSSSQGLLHDYREFKMNLNYVLTESGILFRDDLVSYLQSDSRNRAFMSLHSQACAIGRNVACDIAHMNFKDRIDALFVAPAAYGYSDHFNMLRHIRSDRDFIPLRFDKEGAIREAHTTTVLKPYSAFSLLDHSYTSRTFEPPIKKSALDFIRN